MERTLSSLTSEPRYVEEVQSYLQEGCKKKPLVGGLYCSGCEQKYDDPDDDGEPTDDVAQIVFEHRHNDAGKFEYLVLDINEEGATDSKWVGCSEVSESSKRAYETARLRSVGAKNRKRKQRARIGMAKAPVPDHVLGEDHDDKGACEIDKSKVYGDVRKFQRRRLGGIIAAVSGCRIILDWEEHQFGEGTAHVYVVLARLVSALQKAGGQMPKVVFMDNACALEKFATNPKRCHRTEIAKKLSTFHYMLDKWHAVNHSSCLADPARARWLDPRHEQNKAIANEVNTSACEQCFSFIDRITYVGVNMHPGRCQSALELSKDAIRGINGPKSIQLRNKLVCETPNSQTSFQPKQNMHMIIPLPNVLQRKLAHWNYPRPLPQDPKESKGTPREPMRTPQHLQGIGHMKSSCARHRNSSDKIHASLIADSSKVVSQSTYI